jgi:hypothetical protein
MSLAVHIPPPVPPILAVDPTVPSPTPTDAMTLAVLKYLAAMRLPITNSDDLKAQADALGVLVAICYKACQGYKRKDGGKLFLWDVWPEYSVQFNAPEPADDAPLIDLDIGSKSRRENTNHHRLREWIELWVLRRVAAYLDKSDEEIQAAAADGEFRLGWRCVLALRKKVARSYPKDGHFNRVCVSLDRSYAAPDVKDGEDTSLVANVVGPDLNLDPDCDPHSLTWLVDDPIDGYRHEFDRLGVTDVLTEILRGLTLDAGADTKNVAALSGVSERQARNQIDRCYEILYANRDRPAIKELHAALDTHPHYELPPESADSKFRRRVLSEAARDKWDGISGEGIRELKAEEPGPEPSDFALDGDEVVRFRQPSLRRLASMVDAADNDSGTYYEDGVEVDRYGDEVGLGVKEVDLE